MRRNGWAVTFSIGTVTCLDGGASGDALLKRADELMYAKKREGNNGIAYAVHGG